MCTCACTHVCCASVRVCVFMRERESEKQRVVFCLYVCVSMHACTYIQYEILHTNVTLRVEYILNRSVHACAQSCGSHRNQKGSKEANGMFSLIPCSKLMLTLKHNEKDKMSHR